MDRLPSVIGPAPSELSHSELIAKLRVERKRVMKEVDDFLASFKKPKKKAPGKAKGKKKGGGSLEAKLKRMAKEAGIPLSAILKQLEEDEKTNGDS